MSDIQTQMHYMAMVREMDRGDDFGAHARERGHGRIDVYVERAVDFAGRYPSGPAKHAAPDLWDIATTEMTRHA